MHSKSKVSTTAVNDTDVLNIDVEGRELVGPEVSAANLASQSAMAGPSPGSMMQSSEEMSVADIMSASGLDVFEMDAEFWIWPQQAVLAADAVLPAPPNDEDEMLSQESCSKHRSKR